MCWSRGRQATFFSNRSSISVSGDTGLENSRRNKVTSRAASHRFQLEMVRKKPVSEGGSSRFGSEICLRLNRIGCVRPRPEIRSCCCLGQPIASCKCVSVPGLKILSTDKTPRTSVDTQMPGVLSHRSAELPSGEVRRRNTCSRSYHTI